MSKTTPGLIRRPSGIWHIDKVIEGYGRLCMSTRTKDRREAEKRLVFEAGKLHKAAIYGEPIPHTFEEAADRYLKEATHKSVERDRQIITALKPWIGSLDVRQVHHDTVKPYMDKMLEDGAAAGTVKRHLSVITNILNKCARLWRDPAGNPWLGTVPLFKAPDGPSRPPRPLSWVEEGSLLAASPDYMEQAIQFAVNTGLRSNSQANLLWAWEQRVSGVPVFLIPGQYMKGRNKDDFMLVLNHRAQAVIEERRGQHPTHVFTHPGGPFTRMATSAFLTARRIVDLEDVRWHDLRHTFATRLREARVPLETRKALMGHANTDITTHYSAAGVSELYEAVRTIDGDTL